MNARFLSLVKRNHCPSTSARKFLMVLKLSFALNTNLVALLKSVGGVLMVGGSLSTNAWKLPNCLNSAASQSLCQSAFCTTVFVPATALITICSLSSAAIETDGFIRMVIESCVGIAPLQKTFTGETAFAAAILLTVWVI